ncbi:conserved hypothetical protein [Talaromyces stipitatus ATCC 10500]|uniref:Uncharacterized protein n=1 Tax=Talaromyces stipitatus (strain ATCC 10500 / CBS 375.48 / QM 6759 / NRRL 1006) TaxID=441959 RepID=B8MB02_TALSN|nr:uncharacterized protein TSTA_124300 [Talaromyces stipitatus ATCC 10500]EED18703.1 conserved hypothetical protein [Talaromyces stipitatus ATCC 10500]
MPSSETTTTTTTMKFPISPRILSLLFTSLSSPSSNNLPTRQWHLHRILRSDNPADINGELNGIATFHPLQPTPSDDKHDGTQGSSAYRQIIYKEEGEMPSSVMGMAGLKWTKKYIWRLNGANASTEREENNPEMGGISVWFVKIKPSEERNADSQDEPDYLFHEFDFNYSQEAKEEKETDTTKPKFDPPTPPPLILPALRDKYPETTVIQATGDHLCVKDMIVPETGEVLSWASRHVVKGPKKNQDILNLYSIQ